MESQSVDERPLLVLRRVLVALCCVLAFMVMASVFSPSQTRATGPRAANQLPQTTGSEQDLSHISTDPHEGLRQIGIIDDSNYTIRIYATDVGPRYTIVDNISDEELGQLLSLEQVEKAFPQLPLRSMEFHSGGMSGALMLATEQE